MNSAAALPPLAKCGSISLHIDILFIYIKNKYHGVMAFAKNRIISTTLSGQRKELKQEAAKEDGADDEDRKKNGKMVQV